MLRLTTLTALLATPAFASAPLPVVVPEIDAVAGVAAIAAVAAVVAMVAERRRR